MVNRMLVPIQYIFKFFTILRVLDLSGNIDNYLDICILYNVISCIENEKKNCI